MSEKPSWLLRINTLAIAVAVLLFLVAALSGTGYANEWWSVQTAFGMLRYAVFAALGLIALGILLLWGRAFMKARAAGYTGRAVVSSILFAACLALAGNVLSLVMTARAVPFIHDVTTDLENIPQYAVLNPQNPNADNWLILHKAGYPDIQPLTLDMSVSDVISKAEEISKDFGWTVAVADKEKGRLEVTETTRWFGFKDDLVLRVTPGENGGSIVDARSVSRFAGSDIGVNAARIRRLFTALQS